MSSDPALKNIGQKVGLEVWRIKDFELEPVPKEQRGILYSGDSYIFLNTKNQNEWDIHFWLGKDTTSDEMGSAAIKTVEIDQLLGGLPVQYREVQNHESALFMSFFPLGCWYVEGGYDSGYNHVEDMFDNWKPRLFHCKGKRNVRSTQVACKKESLNMGDVFILDLGRDLYVWMPPQSGRLERIKGMRRAQNIALCERHGNCTVHILDEDWRNDLKFWSYFGGREVIPTIAKAKDDDEDFWKTANELVSLWKVSDASGEMKVTHVASGDISIKQLDSKDAFILDAVTDGIYVWVGRECTLEERAKAMSWGQKYLEQKNLPNWTNVTRVLETTEPASFTQWFGDWEEAKKIKSFKPHLYQVSDASGKLVVEEIANYDQESLDGDDVMILDALNLIYVWVGAGATRNEREGAEKTAETFLKQSKLPRHKKTEIETIFQGKETPTFKKFFPSWDDKLFQLDARTVANMRKLLFK